MTFTEQYGGVPESGGNAVDNAIGCTNAVQSAGYHPTGEYLAGQNVWAEGGTNPTSIDFDGSATSEPLSSMNGGGKRKKKSRKLKRSNKSRLNSKSKKSRSKSVRKSKKVRKTLSKRRVSLKRKSNKKRSKRSKRSRKSLK